jgi:hypothetical protein
VLLESGALKNQSEVIQLAKKYFGGGAKRNKAGVTGTAASGTVGGSRLQAPGLVMKAGKSARGKAPKGYK